MKPNPGPSRGAAGDPWMKIVADATDDGKHVVGASASSRKGVAVAFSQGAAVVTGLEYFGNDGPDRRYHN